MRTILAVLLLALAVPAVASPTVPLAPYRYLDESTATTGCKAPCSGGTCSRGVSYGMSPTEGMDLSGVYAYHVTVCADPGFTVQNGSNYDVWIYSPVVGGWAQNGESPTYFGANCSGRCCFLEDKIKFARIFGSRLLIAPNVGYVTGGSCLRITYEASMEIEGKR